MKRKIRRNVSLLYFLAQSVSVDRLLWCRDWYCGVQGCVLYDIRRIWLSGGSALRMSWEDWDSWVSPLLSLLFSEITPPIPLLRIRSYSVIVFIGSRSGVLFPMSHSFLDASIPDVVRKLKVDEKISLLGAPNWWNTNAIPRLGIPAVRMSDGPNVWSIRPCMHSCWSLSRVSEAHLTLSLLLPSACLWVPVYFLWSVS